MSSKDLNIHYMTEICRPENLSVGPFSIHLFSAFHFFGLLDSAQRTSSVFRNCFELIFIPIYKIEIQEYFLDFEIILITLFLRRLFKTFWLLDSSTQLQLEKDSKLVKNIYSSFSKISSTIIISQSCEMWLVVKKVNILFQFLNI